jgi:hypothetical protein
MFCLVFGFFGLGGFVFGLNFVRLSLWSFMCDGGEYTVLEFVVV